MKKTTVLVVLLVLALGIVATLQPSASAAPREVILATTTSTQDTGLLDVLVPIFEKKTGFIVKTIAVGTGQALAMGEKGEADVLLVHAPDSELPLVEKGICLDRRLVMHNDFILVGPTTDPAHIKGVKKAADAFERIARAGASFISRGDNSGTHKAELKIWKTAGVSPSGQWYQQSGSGMGQTLNIASYKGAYTLTDRGTFLALRKNLELVILVEGDRVMLNIYHIMHVNPAKFPAVNGVGGKAFADFMVSKDAQSVIGQFGTKEYGQPLFFPDAGKDENSWI